MATIHFLPPELLLLIFDYGSQADYEDSWYPDECRRFLCAVSETHKGWSDMAQELLWENISLDKDRQARRIVESGALDRFPTKSLSLAVHDHDEGEDEQTGLSWENTLAVVSVFLGLENLSINSTYMGHELHFRLLGLPNLSTLHSLSLAGTYFNSVPTDPITLPFSLTSLNLSEYFSNHPTPYSIFASQSLTSLSLTYWEPHENICNPDPLDEAALVKLVTSVAPNLQYLSLTLPDHLPSLHRALSLCTNLTSLDITDYPSPILAAVHQIPSNLSSLEVSAFDDTARETWQIRPLASVNLILEAVLEDSRLEQLGELTFSTLHNDELARADTELMEKIAERGIGICAGRGARMTTTGSRGRGSGRMWYSRERDFERSTDDVWPEEDAGARSEVLFAV